MNKFISNLNYFSKNGKIHNIVNLFDNNRINLNLLKKYSINEPIHYQKNIIFKNNIFELVLINWEKGAFTTFHNHPENGCVLKILDGKLYEISKDKSLVLSNNDINLKLHNEYHKILALEKTYSLHYYSPPNFYN